MNARDNTLPLRSLIAQHLSSVEDATVAQIARAVGQKDFPSRVVAELNAMRTDALIECERRGKSKDLSYWLAVPVHQVIDASPVAETAAGVPSDLPEEIKIGTRAAQIWDVLRGDAELTAREIASALKCTTGSLDPVISALFKSSTIGRTKGQDRVYRYHRPRNDQHEPQPEVAETQQERYQGLFEYRDGSLYWRKSKGTAKAGSKAGTRKPSGHNNPSIYEFVQVDGKTLPVHRVVFEMFNGYCPECIDHADGDPLNNRIENLRGATFSDNRCNSKITSRNTSGFKGVYFDKEKKKYRAEIRKDGKRAMLGYFETAEAASEAYKNAAQEMHGEFANFEESPAGGGIENTGSNGSGPPSEHRLLPEAVAVQPQPATEAPASLPSEPASVAADVIDDDDSMPEIDCGAAGNRMPDDAMPDADLALLASGVGSITMSREELGDLMALAGAVTGATIDRAADHLAEVVTTGDIEPCEMDLEELAERAAAELRNARALADKLQHLLDSKTHECEALRAQHQPKKGGLCASQIDSFVMLASKRKPRRITKMDNARAAAVAAIRAGAQRAEVFALVPIGRAVRGAEWREA